MNLQEVLLDTIFLMKTAKLRTALTMLGIIIGISSVIVLTSIGKGQTKLLKEIFDKMGTNIIELSFNRNYNGPYKTSYIDRFKYDDYKIIEKNPNVVETAYDDWMNSVEIIKPANFKLPKNSRIQPKAASSSFFDMSNTEFVAGRNFSKDEINDFLIIGNGLASLMFGSPQNALGKQVYFKVMYRAQGKILKFTIIGVIQNPKLEIGKITGKSNYMQYLFYTPVHRYIDLRGWDFFVEMLCKIAPGVDLDKAGKQLADQACALKKVPENVFIYKIKSSSMKRSAEAIEKQNLYVALIAGISLFVGGIVIMNIMLFTVTERTREIGIKKALGAKKRDIISQFLFEASILSFIGGLIGIVVGCGGTLISGYFLSVPPVIDIKIILMSVIVSILIGIIFGLYPANKAANMDPVEALRKE
jgi:putative ABC transport system permease protein